MSFGWSASDLATAITLTYKLIQALDTCDGATAEYREAVSFLRDLKRVLEPLQTFTACNVNASYSKEIGEQVGYIKEPVEQFLAVVLKYEPSLGASAKEGHHRHVFRKLQWFALMPKKLAILRKKIESHMWILDTLMQRLTLDAVLATQQQLPVNVKLAFQQMIQPELVAILQENLTPLKTTVIEDIRSVQSTNHVVLATTLENNYAILSAGMQEIKAQIKDASNTQLCIKSCLQGNAPQSIPAALPAIESKLSSADEFREMKFNQPTALMIRESLVELYYLVFLALGHFLRNLFIVLSSMIQPPQALMPALLAQYNISFLDAIGRPARILPYDCFRSFKVLQAFIEHEFKDLPGSEWVGRGRYLVMSLANNRLLNEKNWSANVAPGATVAMSMLVRKRVDSKDSLDDEKCPESSCLGVWKKSSTQSWVTCTVCQKLIFNCPAGQLDLRINEASTATREENTASEPLSNGKKQLKTAKVSRPIRSPSSRQNVDNSQLDFEDNDISLFKRIVQEIIDFHHSNWSDDLSWLEMIDFIFSGFDRCILLLKFVIDVCISPKLSESFRDIAVVKSHFRILEFNLIEERALFEINIESLQEIADCPKTAADRFLWNAENSRRSKITSTLSADICNKISSSMLEISKTLDQLHALLPQGSKAMSFYGVTGELIYSSNKSAEKTLTNVISRVTRLCGALSARNGELGVVIRAALSFQTSEVYESPRQIQVVPAIFEADSTDKSNYFGDKAITRDSKGSDNRYIKEVYWECCQCRRSINKEVISTHCPLVECNNHMRCSYCRTEHFEVLNSYIYTKSVVEEASINRQ